MNRLLLLVLLLVASCAAVPRGGPDVGSFSLDDAILRHWAKSGRKELRCEFRYHNAIYRNVTCWPADVAARADAL